MSAMLGAIAFMVVDSALDHPPALFGGGTTKVEAAQKRQRKQERRRQERRRNSSPAKLIPKLADPDSCRLRQSLETLGEVVGVEECLDVLAKLVVAVVVVAPNSRLFESTVHPLDLPVRPRMIWLCQPM